MEKRMAVYFQLETIRKIEQEYREDNCTSKTKFIEKAVKFYIGYLRQQEEVNYLSPILPAATVRANFIFQCSNVNEWYVVVNKITALCML